MKGLTSRIGILAAFSVLFFCSFQCQTKEWLLKREEIGVVDDCFFSVQKNGSETNLMEFINQQYLTNVLLDVSSKDNQTLSVTIDMSYPSAVLKFEITDDKVKTDVDYTTESGKLKVSYQEGGQPVVMTGKVNLSEFALKSIEKSMEVYSYRWDVKGIYEFHIPEGVVTSASEYDWQGKFYLTSIR